VDKPTRGVDVRRFLHPRSHTAAQALAPLVGATPEDVVETLLQRAFKEINKETPLGAKLRDSMVDNTAEYLAVGKELAQGADPRQLPLYRKLHGATLELWQACYPQAILPESQIGAAIGLTVMSVTAGIQAIIQAHKDARGLQPAP
jgi:hypothetical protein